MPTPEEDAAIDAGIAADPDTYELSKTEFKQLKPVGQRGRPVGSGTKEQITLRIDKEVLDAFRESGEGWQTKINQALKKYLTEHSV
jgi:uncharacterized protein (DUF4415 family)